MTQEDLVGATGADGGLLGAREALRLPQVVAEWEQPGVDDESVAEHGPRGRVGVERRHELRDLVREPDVVLVGQEDRVAATAFHGLLEVRGRTQPLRIAFDHDLEGRALGELLECGDGFVIRRVVTSDQLVGGPALLDQARELRADVGRAVASGQGDRNGSDRLARPSGHGVTPCGRARWRPDRQRAGARARSARR